ncbi:MAG: hypothetical protein PF444_08325 [Bacteroidales bacterium]|jgi:hypothetical protein|nr:hypothetical protein [Bacteroidales bacterium]
MKEGNRVREIGDLLLQLADILSTDVCEILAEELLENMEGRSISKVDAFDIRLYLILDCILVKKLAEHEES